MGVWLRPRLATELDGVVWTYAKLDRVKTSRRLRRLNTALKSTVTSDRS
jgi:hypothetical protein